MNRTKFTLIAAAAAVSMAGCVPSSYGYGNYGGYGSSGQQNPYGQQSPYGYGQQSPYGQQGGYYGQGQSPYYGQNQNQSGYSTSRPTVSRDGTFRCESKDHRTQRCLVDTRSGVGLVRQESDAACIQGRTWGSDRDGLWVTGGCSGRFALGNYGNTSGYSSNGYSNNDSRTVRCESEDGRRDVCGLPFRARDVRLSRQISDTRCSEGSTWGWSGDAVWVDRGCRGEFVASN